MIFSVDMDIANVEDAVAYIKNFMEEKRKIVSGAEILIRGVSFL